MARSSKSKTKSSPPPVKVREGSDEGSEDTRSAAEREAEAAELAELKSEAPEIVDALGELQQLIQRQQSDYVDPRTMRDDSRSNGEHIGWFRGTRAQAIRHWRAHPAKVPVCSATERVYTTHEVTELGNDETAKIGTLRRISFRPDSPTFLERERAVKLFESHPLWSRRLKIWNPEEQVLGETGQL